MNVSIAPYQGIRYHLEEHNGRVLMNPKELFNLKHSMLRLLDWASICHTQESLQNPYLPLVFYFKTQFLFVLACFIVYSCIAVLTKMRSSIRVAHRMTRFSWHSLAHSKESTKKTNSGSSSGTKSLMRRGANIMAMYDCIFLRAFIFFAGFSFLFPSFAGHGPAHYLHEFIYCIVIHVFYSGRHVSNGF